MNQIFEAPNYPAFCRNHAARPAFPGQHIQYKFRRFIWSSRSYEPLVGERQTVDQRMHQC